MCLCPLPASEMCPIPEPGPAHVAAQETRVKCRVGILDCPFSFHAEGALSGQVPLKDLREKTATVLLPLAHSTLPQRRCQAGASPGILEIISQVPGNLATSPVPTPTRASFRVTLPCLGKTVAKHMGSRCISPQMPFLKITATFSF